MIDQILEILEILEHAGAVINLFAVGVIVVGFARSLGRYAMQYKKLGPEADFVQFKIGLGRALTLGLEILIIADVIETITVEPTFGSLGVLAFLVVVRTLVSWTVALEIEGHWLWQAPAEEQGNG
jgi:uncharacterized membrane protein